MRIMVRFSFPVEDGNELISTGRIGQIIQMFTEEVKPEAAYFFLDGGERGGLFVVNMQDGSEVALVAERLFHGLNASIEMTPVMTGEDLQKAMGSNMEGIVKRFG